MNVLLQICCLRKWLATEFTFVIFVSFMNNVNVFHQRSYRRKWFATSFTSVMIIAFMKGMDMFPQIFAIVVFVALMNCMHVSKVVDPKLNINMISNSHLIRPKNKKKWCCFSIGIQYIIFRHLTCKVLHTPLFDEHFFPKVSLPNLIRYWCTFYFNINLWMRGKIC